MRLKLGAMLLSTWSLAISVAMPKPAHAEAPQYAEHQDLSYVLDDHGTRTSIDSVADWELRRSHILAGMQEVMGPLPPASAAPPLDMRTLETHTSDGLLRRKISYHTSDGERRVHAWLLTPQEARRLPAVLCLHQTVPEGKDSPAGLADRPTMHYALELARRGYVTLAPDYPSLGESAYDFDADDFESGSMVAIVDNIRAVDLLQSLPEVDPERIGCIGHSLGGHNGLFTAAFEQRIKVVVSCCGFTRFARYKGGDLTGWCGPRYMPRIETMLGRSPEKMPFDFGEVLAAIAPRAVHVVAPLRDDNFDVTGVREAIASARPIFELLGSDGKLSVSYPECEHDFPDGERERAYQALDRALKSTSD
jgi:pimeloyl-ACP methyl ester carboxylesterase